MAKTLPQCFGMQWRDKPLIMLQHADIGQLAVAIGMISGIYWCLH